MRSKHFASMGLLLAIGVLGSCGGDDESGGDPGPDAGEVLDPTATFSVTGTVLDLKTQAAVEGSATVVVEGIQSNPTVSVTGTDFEVTVPANSTFNVLAGSPPNYRATYNAAIEVGAEDVTGADVYVVSEAFITEMQGTFGVVPTPGTGLIIGRAVDEAGVPLADIPASAFDVPANTLGPFFLDAEVVPDANATATSASGLVVFFDVPAGVTAMTAAAGAPYTIAAPDAPVAANTASYIEATVTTGEVPVLMNVSFAGDVVPVFGRRGCVACHDGGGAGKDLGNLHFNGSVEKTFKELAEEVSPKHGTLRINTAMPDMSLILTLPRCQAHVCPADPAEPLDHPFATFTGLADPDYQILRTWIAEGALNN